MQSQVITAARSLLCCALAFAVSADASVIVQLRVVEGEGITYRTGTRATRGVTVLVTDEAGLPLDMASVSFRLPDQGATGTFSSGLRTEVVTTGPDGRASVWGMQWNKTPGTVQIHITAVKEQARAGIISTQYLSDSVAPKAGGEGVFTASHTVDTSGSGSPAIAGLAAGGAGSRSTFARVVRHPSNPATSWPQHRRAEHYRRASVMEERGSRLLFLVSARVLGRNRRLRLHCSDLWKTARAALRPAYGLAGNFILGPSIAGKIVSASILRIHSAC